MPPFGYNQGRQPPGMKPHLVVKLRPGWSYDSKHRLFVTTSGKSFSPRESLPRGTRISYMVPDLAKRALKSLSRDERNLARYLQIIMPKGMDPNDYLDSVGRWDCTEEVSLPPEISLP